VNPLNVDIRIFPVRDGWIALLTDFNGGACRLTSDDPDGLVADVQEWMKARVEK
jgi:hypothetical protein